MKNLPFQRQGRFFRGNLHTHSTVSDGSLSPEEVISLYRQHGYHFLAITDHFRDRFGFPITDTRSFRDEEFTTLLGAELHAPALENGEIWHIVAVGLPLDFVPPAVDELAPALARRAVDAGAFVGAAHPAWYGQSLDDMRSLDAAHAIEIYNQTCAMTNDRGESWYVADMLLSEGHRYLAFGSDDTHFHDERPDCFGAWVMVRAEELAPDALLEALKSGHFYTSQGPVLHEIEVSPDRSEITVRCSPVNSIFVTGRAQLRGASHGLGLMQATFPLEQFQGSYCRVTVVDGVGKRAWSNPIWID